ncbi:MAG: hypothetical protein ABIH10_00890 [Spirochaetota bacterium]
MTMREHLVGQEQRLSVEIYNGNIFMGLIYPTEKGIKVVSSNIPNNPEAAIKIERKSIPEIFINLV